MKEATLRVFYHSSIAPVCGSFAHHSSGFSGLPQSPYSLIRLFMAVLDNTSVMITIVLLIAAKPLDLLVWS